MMSVKCTACQDGAWLPNGWKCDVCERVAHHSLHRPCSAHDTLTPEQHLKGIFVNLDMAEKQKEPERTRQLRRMISIALKDLQHVQYVPNRKFRYERPM